MRGVSRDLRVVKAKTSEGLVARLLTVGIVCIVVVLISESSGAFLQNSRTGPPRRARRWCCCRPFPFSNAFSNLVSEATFKFNINLFSRPKIVKLILLGS